MFENRGVMERQRLVDRQSWQTIVLACCLVTMAGNPLGSMAVEAAESDARYAPTRENPVGQWLRRLSLSRLPGEFERGHASVTGAFRGIAAPASPWTVRILSDDQQTALGMVVREDGYILTKASELSGKLACLFSDGVRLPARKVAEKADCDLALLLVNRQRLPVPQWASSAELPLGSWLVTTGPESLPIAIGVVSAPPQASAPPQPILGVRMYRVERGVRVNQVIPGTGAHRAGIRAGDVIASINGRVAETPDTITEIVQQLQPGDKVHLSVLREQSPLTLDAFIGDKGRLGGFEQAELMDSLGGPLSRRRAGFPSVIQHDSIVRPRECGGPVLDLDGQVVGVNIARVSRVATYALPASVVRPVVEELLRNATAP